MILSHSRPGHADAMSNINQQNLEPTKPTVRTVQAVGQKGVLTIPGSAAGMVATQSVPVRTCVEEAGPSFLDRRSA